MLRTVRYTQKQQISRVGKLRRDVPSCALRHETPYGCKSHEIVVNIVSVELENCSMMLRAVLYDMKQHI
ncbi:hypothetical protein J6590_064589 [Homalodisca vitripennis]|nr:hypothetical protein J6590_064589 [Homalodisca vitripennis]